jgi:tetratricopeptide (TPR) repeat protein
VSPPTAASELQRGLAARAAGRYDVALRAFEAAIGLDASNPAGYLLAADEHLRAGRFPTALELADKTLALASTPGNRRSGLQIRALALLRLNRLRAAADAARDAIACDPLNPGGHTILAQTLWRRRQFRQAEASLRHALWLDPARLNTLLVTARFLHALKRHGEAASFAEQAAAVSPDNTDVRMLRGRIALAMGRIEMAQDMALWALSREADNPAALDLLAMVKAHRNWFSRPFWWMQSLPARGIRILPAAVVAGIVIGLGLAILRPLVPVSLVGHLPPEATVKHGFVALFILYIAVCGIIAERLRRQNRKKVRLSREF